MKRWFWCLLLIFLSGCSTDGGQEGRDNKTRAAFAQNWPTQKHASDLEEIDQIFRQFRSGEHVKMAAVVKPLGKFLHKKDLLVERFFACLKDPKDKVRAHAALMLGYLGDSRAVEPLTACLEDPETHVQIMAAVALRMLGQNPKISPEIADQVERMTTVHKTLNPWDVDGLLAHVEDKDREIRCHAIGMLGVLRENRAVDILIRCLKDADPFVRCQAATALGAIGDSRAFKPLVDCLKDSDSVVHHAAVFGLGKLDDPRVYDLIVEEIDKRKDQFISDAEHSSGKPGGEMPFQSKPLKKNPLKEVEETRNYPEFFVTCEMVRRGKAPSKLLVPYVKHKNSTIRLLAVDELGRQRDPQTVEPLIAYLKEGNAEVRVAAVNALGQLADARAVEPLMACLNDQNREVRRAAIEALGELRDPRAVQPLVALMKERDSSAAFALGQIGQPAVEPLVACLKDPDWHVRNLAAGALRSFKYQPQTTEAQIQLLIAAQKWDELVRFGEAAVEPLIPYLDDTFTPVREGVARTLGKLRDPRAVPPLLRRLTDRKDRSVWITDALVEIGPPAVESLIACLNHEDSVVRGRSVEALGKIGEPRAIKPLTVCLKDEDQYVGQHAVYALLRFGEAAIGPLAAAIKSPEPARLRVANLLQQLGYQPKTLPDTVDLLVAKRDWDGLASMGQKAVPPLCSWLLHLDSEIRGEVAKVLPKITPDLPATETDFHLVVIKPEWDAFLRSWPDQIHPFLIAVQEKNPDLFRLSTWVADHWDKTRHLQILQNCLEYGRGEIAWEAALALAKFDDYRGLGVLVDGLPNWHRRKEVHKVLTKIHWRPSSDPEEVYWHVMAEDWNWLDDHWETTKKILLDDLRSAEFRRIEHAAYALISISREEIIPDLIQALEKHGTKEMAETFANCGNTRLLETARSWAARHGYVEGVGHGAQEAFWGQKGGTRIEGGHPIPLGTPIPGAPGDGEKSQGRSKSSKGSSSQSPFPPDNQSNPAGPQDALAPPWQTQPALDPSEHTQRETAFSRLQEREITRKPLEDPTRRTPLSNPATQRPLYDPARQKPLVEPWRQAPDPARLPGMAPPVRLPPDPGRLAPPSGMSVPSPGPSFGPRF